MYNTKQYKPDDTDILRQISIVDYLDNHGFKPVKRHRTGKELLYLSPMRNESKPSFSVNTEKNLSHGYGTSEGRAILFAGEEALQSALTQAPGDPA